MFRLILMRHADSEWARAGQSDYDRSLSADGVKGIPAVAKWMSGSDYVPSIILASGATRTRQTANVLIQQWDKKPVLITTDDLYLAGPETIERVIHRDSCDLHSLMLIGHNPGLSYLASALADQVIQMPTAGVMVFDVSVDRWSDFRIGSDVRLVDSTNSNQFR